MAIGTNEVLLEAPPMLNDDNAVRSSAIVNANTEVGVPIFTDCALIAVMVGGAFTVKTKLVVEDNPPPSRTVNVMVALPVLPMTGVTVTVRDAPVPAKTILATGTSIVLLEASVTVNDVTGVRSSPTVKFNAEVAVLILIS